MRSIAVVILLLLAATSGAPAGVLSGNVTSSRTLTLAESPWLVTSDVEVRFGAILTIEAGVVVQFEDSYWIETDIGNGSAIVAVGAPGDSIVFESALPSPGPDSWEWVGVYDSDASVFRHCIFRHGDQTLRISTCSPTVELCRFQDNKTSIWCVDAAPEIQSCTITEWTFVGIVLEKGSSPDIHDCNIFQHGPGARQGESIRLMSYQPPTMVTINAERNWWGTIDPQEIEDAIYHSIDSGGVWGTVDFDPWLYELPVEEMSWGRLKSLFSK